MSDDFEQQRHRRQNVEQCVREWPETGARERKRLLRVYPELATHGLKVSDPIDREMVARDEEATAQTRLLDEGPADRPADSTGFDENELRDETGRWTRR